jgi:predicted dithiol-disulfide oxidoreductase (DUF899 family)
MFNAAYHHLDIAPVGRNEENLPYHMDWVRLRDEFERSLRTLRRGLSRARPYPV